MNKLVLASVLIFLTNICNADNLAYFYAPSAGVRGDIAEKDLIENDDYTFLTVEPGFLRAIRWTRESDAPFYIEYSSISTKDELGELDENRYQSFSLGVGQYNVNKIDNFLSTYRNITVGIGFARFNFDDVKHRALGEAGINFGLRMAESVNLGIIYKYQIIGYPSETMASANIVGISFSINY